MADFVPVPPVVSARWLAEHLDDPAVAIADCRFSLADPGLGAVQYAEGHIPGAVYFDLNRDLSAPPSVHGGRHPLPNPDNLADTLGQAGITSQDTGSPTWVVAYDSSRLAFAARFWWLLRWLGHERVSVLDGGFAGWKAAGYAIATEAPCPAPGQFHARPQADWVVDAAAVQARAEAVLIDSRAPERYRGEQEPIDPVAGHIPGAVNLPWQDATDERGFLRSPTSHRQRWLALLQNRDAIVYCGSGVTACVNLLSMHLAGLPYGRLYAGSWSDWCSHALPVATGAEPGTLTP